MRQLAKIFEKPITSLLFSGLLGFLVSALVLSFAGLSPTDVILSLINGVFSRPKYIANVVIKSTPLILTGVSFAISFKIGLFNMGAEGQYIMGAIAATLTGMIFDFPSFFQILFILLAGILAGTSYGALVGILKSKFGVHEVISGIMLNWIALYVCNFVVNLESLHRPNSNSTFPIRESGFSLLKNQFSFLEDTNIGEILKTDINIGIFLAIVVAIASSFLINKTKKGYEIRAIGLNENAAKFSGINVKKNIIHTVMISGGISGFASALMITGTSPHCLSTLGGFEGYGFNGLPVALIASSSSVGCIFSGLFFSGLIYGGKSMQSDLGASSEIINIMIGTIIFFVSIAKIFPILIKRFSKKEITP